MSGWDSWATNVQVAAGEGACGAAVYDPCSGAIWGKAGDFDCSGGFNQYDFKACGKDANVPAISGKTFMFIRQTMDDDPAHIFKKNESSMFTTKGPSGSRVAVRFEGKPEPAVARVVSYLKEHV